MAVLAEAIERERRAGRIEALGRIVDFAGYRRQLAARFRGWTREERGLDRPPPADSAKDTEEWAIYRSYRATLRQVDAEDAEGWRAWASGSLAKQIPSELRKPGHVVVVDPISPTRAAWRLLDHCHRKARSVTVTLPFDPDPSLAELYAGVDETRRQLLGWGFVEEIERVEGFSFRPAGLVAIERELFRSDAAERPPIRLVPDKGLAILGGPRGEGVGLLIAREIGKALDRGVEPDEILVLVPRLDSDAERIRETLLASGLPVQPAVSGRLVTIPAISALRLAMRLPVEGWETATLVQLLRNGQVHIPGFEGSFRPERYEAASAIHATRVFRDRVELLEALERRSADPAQGRAAAIGLRAVRAIIQVIDATVGPGPWAVEVERLQRLAEGLGIDPGPLEPLWDALDEQGWVLKRLGPAIAEELLTWSEFARQVEATVGEVNLPPPDETPGTIRVEAVDDAEGARARVVILANLTERSFPASSTIDLEASPGPDLTYATEMLRFARVSGSAEELLILAYPTTDRNGEALLAAGFLDDLVRRLDGRSAEGCVEKHSRFDPVLFDQPELAKAPADARVRAMALAASGQDSAALRDLAGDSKHQAALLGVAEAFEVAHSRRVDRDFGPFDGRLLDPRAIDRIRETFGPDHAFSASQLESFATCPFQFFQRYVLGLKLVDERQELDEDYAGRGTDVHDVLEKIHQQASSEQSENLIDRLNVLVATEFRVELGPTDPRPSSVPQVLREIGDRRTEKAVARYLHQFRAYAGRDDDPPKPHSFEVSFGEQERKGEANSLPYLTIGEGENSVKFQGKIDRIDLVRDKAGKVSFRVIDYKTGSNPSDKDVLTGLASQLPLYALAVERLVFPGGDYDFGDAGYWNMPKAGYRPIKFKEWPAYRDLLMNFVVDLVARLREGHFPIESQKKECRKYCDYHASCRVVEVRMVGKAWAARPTLGDGS